MITSVPPPPPSSPFLPLSLSPSHPLHTTAQPLPHHLHILHSSPSLLPSSFPSPSPSTSLHALLLSHAPFFLFPPFLSLSPTSSLASPPSSSASPSPSPLLLPTLPHPTHTPLHHTTHFSPDGLASGSVRSTCWRWTSPCSFERSCPCMRQRYCRVLRQRAQRLEQVVGRMTNPNITEDPKV